RDATVTGVQTCALPIFKLPGGKPSSAARVVLLPPKYTEVWSRQVQQRLDNYWETFKPEFAVNKEHFADYYKLAHSESLRYVMTTDRKSTRLNSSHGSIS